MRIIYTENDMENWKQNEDYITYINFENIKDYLKRTVLIWRAGVLHLSFNISIDVVSVYIRVILHTTQRHSQAHNKRREIKKDKRISTHLYTPPKYSFQSVKLEKKTS